MAHEGHTAFFSLPMMKKPEQAHFQKAWQALLCSQGLGSRVQGFGFGVKGGNPKP